MTPTAMDRLALTLIAGAETHTNRAANSARRPGSQRFTLAITFADASELAVDGVVWATGFRLDHGFLELPVIDDGGRVCHRRGVTEVPGLAARARVVNSHLIKSGA